MSNTQGTHGAGSLNSYARGKGQQSRNNQEKGKSRGNQQQQQNRTARFFEPYWTPEAVSAGIKRGELIVGPIRINPKNYLDAYVPSKDGKTDVYIEGMADRNRALNMDEVVVELYPYSQWRVFMEDFEHFERTVSASNLECLDRVNDAKPNDINESDEDSGPDVIFDTDSNDEAEGSVNDLSQAIKTLKVSETPPVNNPNKSQKSSSPEKRSLLPKSEGTIQKVKSTPGNMDKSPAAQKFPSVSYMMENGSPLAKNLFCGGKEGHASVGDVSGGKFVQPKGKVVYIYEKKHSRAASGRIKLMPNRNKSQALFSPCDSRVPGIIIPMSDCPKDFYERPADFSSTLYIARILQWEETSKMPKGTLARSLGEAGQIEPETEAMLIEMGVDDSPFSDEVNQCLPDNLPWSIPEHEYSYRKDLRRCCIFTIDPATARDLDDAVSIEELGNGRYQVGVHIADVSYFVKEDTELDAVASRRATSVYLVQKVIPMLPRLLCEELCSLNPDHDRLTFSVMWVIDEQGMIYDEWYGRSVIRSCVKLSYDHAQGFIEQPDKVWTRAELPPITNSFDVQDVMSRVLLLNKIAVNLRKQRFDNGALRLDQVKLQYTLNSETGLPNGYFVYQQKDSNRLIEEFMLLANMAVAHKIKTSFPDKAILRRHPPPQHKPLEAVEELCGNLGLQISGASAGELQRSLWKYYGEDDYALARIQVLVVLISKPMQNAKYFCSGSFPDETMYHHYALNVPLYTHFTSPIRRYPDIMVHRLLAASLGYSSATEKETELLQKQADFCNDKKQNAKMASDRSSDMYFAIFVKEAGPLEESGMVMAVLNKSFDVLILKLGVVKRVYVDQLPLKSYTFRKNMKCPELLIEWKADKCKRPTKHLITLFTQVECCVFAEKEPLKWSCIIRRPKEEITYEAKKLNFGGNDDDEDDSD
ncbi:hypothetical protein BsWGS_26710 [Bradybaena similaris]